MYQLPLMPMVYTQSHIVSANIKPRMTFTPDPPIPSSLAHQVILSVCLYYVIFCCEIYSKVHLVQSKISLPNVVINLTSVQGESLTAKHVLSRVISNTEFIHCIRITEE